MVGGPQSLTSRHGVTWSDYVAIDGRRSNFSILTIEPTTVAQPAPIYQTRSWRALAIEQAWDNLGLTPLEPHQSEGPGEVQGLPVHSRGTHCEPLRAAKKNREASAEAARSLSASTRSPSATSQQS